MPVAPTSESVVHVTSKSSLVYRFICGDGPWEHVDVALEEDGTISICGGRRITVQPQAGNVVFVRVVKAGA